MLQNASFLDILAVHTAENEPSKVGDAVKAKQADRHRAGQTTCEGTVLGSRDEDLRPHKDIKTVAPTGSSGQHLSRSAATAKLRTVTVAPPPRLADGERRRGDGDGTRVRAEPAHRLRPPSF